MEAAREAQQLDTGTSDSDRFLLELEFVQSLSNPAYLNWLAQNRYLDDPSFIAYLKYLNYWKQPQYAAFVVYPQCFKFLDLLQTPQFRAAIANTQYQDLVNAQQFYFWKDYKNNRVNDITSSNNNTSGEGQPTGDTIEPKQE